MIVHPLIAITLFMGLAGLIAIAVKDVKDRIIPNRLVVYLAGVGLALRLGSGLASIGWSLIGAGCVFVVLVFLAHHSFIGGGDAKIIAVVTFLVPPDRIIPLLLDISLAGGLLSCFYLTKLFFTKNVRPPAGNIIRHMFRKGLKKIDAGTSFPYALAVLGGTVVCVLSEVFQCFNATSCSL